MAEKKGSVTFYNWSVKCRMGLGCFVTNEEIRTNVVK